VRYGEGSIPYIVENGQKNIGDGKQFEKIIKSLL